MDENGQLAGEANKYFDNGKLSTVSKYKNGKKFGESKWYWKNGKLRGSVSFNENEKCPENGKNTTKMDNWKILEIIKMEKRLAVEVLF